MSIAPRTKTAAIALAVSIGALAVPASSLGAVSFGSALTDDPGSGLNTPSNQCDSKDLTKACTRVGVRFPSQPGADQDQKSPIDGVVVKFRIKAGSPHQVTFRIARLAGTGADVTARAVGAGPTATLAGTGAIEEYPARIPVLKGDRVALDSTATNAVFGNSGGTRQYKFTGPLVQGQGPRGATDTEDEELLLAAVVEPDADKDGFGDGSQDGCPTNPAVHGACPKPPKTDVTKPGLGSASLAPAAFTAASGTQVLFRLTEAAKVSFRIDRKLIGRKTVRGACVRVTRLNRSRPHCTRYATVARFAKTAVKGLNTFHRSTRGLAVGSYRLVIRATDAAGNRSLTRTIAFRIKRA